VVWYIFKRKKQQNLKKNTPKYIPPKKKVYKNKTEHIPNAPPPQMLKGK